MVEVPDGQGMAIHLLVLWNHLSRWALKKTTRLRNVNCLKSYIQGVFGTLHNFTHFGLIMPTYLMVLWTHNGLKEEKYLVKLRLENQVQFNRIIKTY